MVEEAAELPLLRPLIDRDKPEIVEIAKQLGTYEISILPDEDCCQLFSSKLAVTRGQPTTCARSSAPRTSRSSWTALVDSAELHHPRASSSGAIVSGRAPIAQPDRATPS